MNDASRLELERLVAVTLPRLFHERLRLELTQRPARAVELGDGDRSAVSPLLFDLREDDQHRPLLVQAMGRVGPDAKARMRRLGRRAPHAVTLLVAPRIGGAARKRLRDARVNFADFAGNIFIRAPGIRIDVQGDERPTRLTHPQRVNPFSKRASLVFRALFEAPSERLGVVALAQRTGLAKGWVSQVVSELNVRGYVSAGREGVHLADPVGALRDWLAIYSWRRNTLHSLLVPYEYDELLHVLPVALGDASWALTLLAGAQQVAPHVHYRDHVHLYVAPGAHELVWTRLGERLFAEPASADGGNLQLLHPYYGAATFFGAQRVGELPIVSSLQLLLDLAHFPVRGAEAAEAILRGPFARRLSLRPRQIAELMQELE